MALDKETFFKKKIKVLNIMFDNFNTTLVQPTNC